MENGPLIQVLFTSLVADEVDAGDIFAIVQSASQRFADMNVTGHLILAHGRFFQVLEGRADILDPWVKSVERDPRHHSMKVWFRQTITSRQFKGWRLRRLILPDQNCAWHAFEGIIANKRDAVGILRAFDNYLANQTKMAG